MIQAKEEAQQTEAKALRSGNLSSVTALFGQRCPQAKAKREAEDQYDSEYEQDE